MSRAEHGPRGEGPALPVHWVIQSFEPGEDWFYDYETQMVFTGPNLAEPTAHPAEQTAPGPLDRLPGNWMDLIHR